MVLIFSFILWLTFLYLSGLNPKTKKSHQSVWDAFCSSKRSDRPPLKFKLMDDQFNLPPLKQKVCKSFNVTSFYSLFTSPETIIWMVYSERNFENQLDVKVPGKHSMFVSTFLGFGLESRRLGWTEK